LALVLSGVLGAHLPSRATAARPAAVAVHHGQHADSAAEAPARPAATATPDAAVQVPALTAQHITDVRVSRAPPAAVA
ncbi:hypothetical protein, partial [Actinoplanes philippinensis]|uniref:hypothetical protein n=1 Tax=Actinoplanes philippinensis TaxID=35752 RepID=UPI0033F33C10